MSEGQELKFSPSLCQDIIGFQDYLKRLRTVDDSIILNLNTRILTSSSKQDELQNTENCKRFHDQLIEAYQSRDRCIKACLADAESKLTELKKAREANGSDLDVQKHLRREQTKMRMMQKETVVEEIIQDRSLKALQERCRRYINF